MSDALLVALMTGAVSGLVNWGMVKVQLAWLRRDVDMAHRRLDDLARDEGHRHRGD